MRMQGWRWEQSRVRAQDASPEPFPPTPREPWQFQGLNLEEAGVPHFHLKMEDIVWDQVPGNVREVVLWGLSGGRREGSSKWAGPLRVARRGVLVTCQSSTTWAKL